MGIARSILDFFPPTFPYHSLVNRQVLQSLPAKSLSNTSISFLYPHPVQATNIFYLGSLKNFLTTFYIHVFSPLLQSILLSETSLWPYLLSLNGFQTPVTRLKLLEELSRPPPTFQPHLHSELTSAPQMHHNPYLGITAYETPFAWNTLYPDGGLHWRSQKAAQHGTLTLGGPFLPVPHPHHRYP